jgi:hypothetical protein
MIYSAAAATAKLQPKDPRLAQRADARSSICGVHRLRSCLIEHVRGLPCKCSIEHVRGLARKYSKGGHANDRFSGCKALT